MTTDEAVERLQGTLAHLWMIRTFLKHADEVQDDEAFLEVPRLLYDSIRAVEPAFLRGDRVEYLRRLKGKMGKLRKISIWFSAEYATVSAHTNFEQAALSLKESVREMDAIFEAVKATPLDLPEGV